MPDHNAQSAVTDDALGEFALIARIIARLGDAAATDILVPPGDDAAIWLADSRGVVGTIDALTEGTHWRADTMTLEDVGWRAVTANVSDLAAMGATPGYLLVAASLGPGLTPGDLDAFIDGLAGSCRGHRVRVAGGDIVRGPATMFTIAAYGSARFEGDELRALRRDAAQVGDLVAVTGHPGASAAGLALIERGSGDGVEATPLVAAHRRPIARTEVGAAAVTAGISCAIDVSDGLMQDLDHIAERSDVGIEIDCSAVPVHPAARALLGGEDFELVLAGATAALEMLADDVSVIGRVVSEHRGQTVALDGAGQQYEPRRRGWDQLANSGVGASS
jgi:thiamine-monophosphate kinase